MRREQEILDSVLVVELHNLADYRERRIVDDDTVLLVLVPLIVSTGPERADHVVTLHTVHLADPVKDRLVYVVRREAVVRCFLRFELVDKLSVLIRYLLKRHLLRDVLHFSAVPPLYSVFGSSAL